ncbi:MAG: ATP-grasp domain-containing protein [Minisyncoccia bacterium]
MKLREFEGKELFRTYGIEIPVGTVVANVHEIPEDLGACVVKAQVLSGDRKKAGGIRMAENGKDAVRKAAKLLGKKIGGEEVAEVLVEERIDAVREYYVSFSYDDRTRGPVLAITPRGGSGVSKARIFPIDLTKKLSRAKVGAMLGKARFPKSDAANVAGVVLKLWNLFNTEYALLAEINPLFKTRAGKYIAGDAKVIQDNEKHRPTERRNIEMEGDIAILASGGGASMLNMDALMRAGGKPANYTEYSGNPPAEVVRELTKRVLSRDGLRGCWVIGAAANFTDIFTTLSGFLEGLREVSPKPNYPIVIRRDGPRKEEAFELLRAAGEKEGFDFHLFGAEMPMVESAKIMVARAYAKRPKKKV